MQQPVKQPLPEFSFIELQSVDSTNNYARAQIHEGLAQDGSCYFSHEQYAGKGQRVKTGHLRKDRILP